LRKKDKPPKKMESPPIADLPGAMGTAAQAKTNLFRAGIALNGKTQPSFLDKKTTSASNPLKLRQ